MTRLLETDLAQLDLQLNHYEKIFTEKTGQSLQLVAQKAAGLTKASCRPLKTAVVPVSSGLGLIKGFARSVAAILSHLAVPVQVTINTDVAGIQEAYASGSELAFLADDQVFLAFGIGSKVHSDNSQATGRAFAAALIAALENKGSCPQKQPVLVLGAGPVGLAAASYLASQELVPVISDLDKAKAAQLTSQLPQARLMAQTDAKRDFNYIIDATPAAGVITKEDVSKNSIIAVPGMPCGVDAAAASLALVIHNPLELGVAAMYFDCLAQLSKTK